MDLASAVHTNGSDIEAVVFGDTMSVGGGHGGHISSFFVGKDLIDGAQLCLQVILSLTQRRAVSFGDGV